MKPWLDVDGVIVFHGDCIEVLRSLPESSVDSVVTDPPYGLEFMGKEWDSFRTDETRSKRNRGDRAGAQGGTHKESRGAFGRVAYGGGKHPTTSRCLICGKRDQFRNPHACGDMTEWQTEVINPNTAPPGSVAFQNWSHLWTLELYRVLKPGGHLLAFGGTRTWHRLAVAIEDAGFEVRDSIAWMYGSGFPKSHNLKGKHAGFGTALKPAHEPIVVARKPLIGTVAENVLTHGTGALNIDGCRIGTRAEKPQVTGAKKTGNTYGQIDSPGGKVLDQGRWPANVILDESQAAELDKQSGVQKDGTAMGRPNASSGYNGGWGAMPDVVHGFGGQGGASRFFYVAKASKKERPNVDGVAHPTVKPMALMRYLVRLVTPPGGTVLEPFAGSGTTIEACVIEGFNCIAIEREADYLPLIEARLNRPIQAAL
jgi:site-specific DNA-methyltransferase (adenine-specific)